MKAVILAAGYGSRFLPVTKTIPKEMLPLIDRPAISLIVDELLEAGIEDILIISSRRKRSLDDYFDRETELEEVFRGQGKSTALEQIRPPRGHFFFVRQQEMKGTGHALLLAKPFTGPDPFIVAYPDDIFMCGLSLSLQLIHAYEQVGCSILAVQDCGQRDVSRYGVVEPLDEKNPCMVGRLVEKPAAGSEPSRLVSYGRYLYTPEIYAHLEAELKGYRGGEFYHVAAVNRLANEGRLAAFRFKGEHLDTGEPAGYLEAICRYALTRPDLREAAKHLFSRLADEGSDS